MSRDNITQLMTTATTKIQHYDNRGRKKFGRTMWAECNGKSQYGSGTEKTSNIQKGWDEVDKDGNVNIDEITAK